MADAALMISEVSQRRPLAGLEWLLRSKTAEPGEIPFLAADDVNERVVDRALGPYGRSLELGGRERLAGLQQAQVGPEVVPEQLDDGRLGRRVVCPHQ